MTPFSLNSSGLSDLHPEVRPGAYPFSWVSPLSKQPRHARLLAVALLSGMGMVFQQRPQGDAPIDHFLRGWEETP